MYEKNHHMLIYVQDQGPSIKYLEIFLDIFDQPPSFVDPFFLISLIILFLCSNMDIWLTPSPPSMFT